MTEELRTIVSSNEKILYEGKPHKKCLILEIIISPFLPMFILLFFVGFFFLVGLMSSEFTDDELLAIPIFLIFALPPILLCLSLILSIIKYYKNTSYIITDKAVYISSGADKREVYIISFAEISHIELHRGTFDKMYNVGDIIVTTNQPRSITIDDIPNYIDVFNMLKKLLSDINEGTMSPDANQPSVNPEYNTEYIKNQSDNY